MKHLCLTSLIVLGLAGSLCAAPPPPRPINDMDVDKAIEQTRAYLWAQMKPNFEWSSGHSLPRGGETAIALFALLEAGEPISSERMQNALKTLAAYDFEKDKTATYLIAFRTMALATVVSKDNKSPFVPVLKKDFDFLTRPKTPLDIERIGAWGYRGPELVGDNSASQLGLLALWEAERAHMELSPKWIQKIQGTWLTRNQKDGGWTYAAVGNQPSTISMTAAGLASLYICQDMLQQKCGEPDAAAAKMNNGWKFLAEKLPAELAQKKAAFWNQNYLAFCLQRVGMASGAKFIGNEDWFARGASVYAAPSPGARIYNYGDNGPYVQAAFELIFLSRGRIPLTFNKLDYGQANANNWNIHPRDVARFTDYMYRNLEQRMRWQIVDIDSPAELMQDAPMLFVAGDKPLNFTPPQMDKLREYALRGGTIMFMPSHEAGFLASAAAIADGLFEKERKEVGLHYKLEPVPADSPIYSKFQFRDPAVFNPEKFPLRMLTDGTRPLVIVCEKDLAHSWQSRANKRAEADYQMGANVYLYALGNEAPRRRLRPIFVGQGEKQAKTKIQVAWLKHNGNWNTQPYALDYLSQKVTAEENHVGMDIKQGVAFTELKPEYKLAWLTGTTEFATTDADAAAMKAFLAGGGTLFVNSIGGSESFNGSALAFLDKVLDKKLLQLPAGDSPLVTGKFGSEFRGLPIANYLRDMIKDGNAPVTKGARAEGSMASPFRVYVADQRAQVIHAQLGVHDTLDGHTAYGSKSYMPEAAREIAANVILYTAMQDVKREKADDVPADPAKPANPASGPATTQPAK